MKQATLKIKMKVPDDFTAGMCEKCPIVRKIFRRDPCNRWTEYACPLDQEPSKCKLSIKEKTPLARLKEQNPSGYILCPLTGEEAEISGFCSCCDPDTLKKCLINS